MIESSKSTDVGICYGLGFLWNAESPRNLQQTKAEQVGNSESIGDSDKFPDALQLSSSINMAFQLPELGTSGESEQLGAMWLKARVREGKWAND